LDGQRLIIYGGFELPPEDSLYVLDLATLRWSIPKTSGNPPKSRFHHQANVIGNYMVISFGKYDFCQD